MNFKGNIYYRSFYSSTVENGRWSRFWSEIVVKHTHIIIQGAYVGLNEWLEPKDIPLENISNPILGSEGAM